MKEKIARAQKYLAEMKADGWLLYDFCGNNPLSRRFLEIPETVGLKRRIFYWIPQQGEPVKLVHAIEPYALDHAPGQKKSFLSWQSLEQQLQSILQGSCRIAMEYSPKNSIPYISKVDGGTIDLIRSLGVEVVSSGEFLQHFTAVLDEEQAASHLRAGKALDAVAAATWNWLGECLRAGKRVCEYDIQQKILQEFDVKGLTTDHPPIAAVNAHSADPHYAPPKQGSSEVREGDWVLIDLWGKERGERAIFGDITRVAVAARSPTERQKEIFQIVRDAQKRAVELVRSRFQKGVRLEGWEVDDAARQVIERAGYGKFFIHRTGHSIECSLHGSGTHMDNLEMHDVRPVLPATCFSIEPGIYLPGEFGVRLELDLYVDSRGAVHVVGGEQDAIVSLLGAAKTGRSHQ